MTGIEKAVAMFDGSPSKMAAAVGRGVIRQNIEHWLKVRRVPAHRAPDVSAATGIPVDELCPSVNWQVVREAA